MSLEDTLCIYFAGLEWSGVTQIAHLDILQLLRATMYDV